MSTCISIIIEILTIVVIILFCSGAIIAIYAFVKLVLDRGKDKQMTKKRLFLAIIFIVSTIATLLLNIPWAASHVYNINALLLEISFIFYLATFATQSFTLLIIF
eukprot:183978_1